MKKNKKIIKKVSDKILGGHVGKFSDDRDYKKEIEKVPEEKRHEIVKFYNPATGKEVVYPIDRGGTTDQKLAMILSNPEATEEQKMSMLSLYLFEKGRESSSFITDLMLYKGTSTKEMRKFHSAIRLDFTLFTSLFCNFLYDNAQAIVDVLLPGKNVRTFEQEAVVFLKKAKEKGDDLTIRDFLNRSIEGLSIYSIILLEMAIRYASEAQLITKRMEEMTEEREREKGKEVHLDSKGKVINQ